jgi:hypothetical protein
MGLFPCLRRQDEKRCILQSLFHVKRLSYFGLIKRPKTFIKALYINIYLQLKPYSVQLALYVLYCLLSTVPTGLSPVLGITREQFLP